MGRSQKCETALAVILMAASAVFYQFIPEFVSGYRFYFPGTTDQAMTPDFAASITKMMEELKQDEQRPQ